MPVLLSVRDMSRRGHGSRPALSPQIFTTPRQGRASACIDCLHEPFPVRAGSREVVAIMSSLARLCRSAALPKRAKTH